MIIELTQGCCTEIDDEDWNKVEQYSWFAHVRKYTTYVCSSFPKGSTIYMHRVIMPTPEGVWVDHIDGNGLNNKKSNLRPATAKQNNANAYRAANPTGFIGVSLRESGRWQARARIGDRRTSIGMFDTAEEAARAYDKYTRLEYGEYAVLNFPEEFSK